MNNLAWGCRSSTARCYRMPGAAVINFSHGQRAAGGGASGGVNRQANRDTKGKQKPTAVVNPMGENVTPVPNFWASRQQQQRPQQQQQQRPQQQQLRRQGSKEPSPLAQAAQKIGVPAPIAQPPDPKNLPVPNFSKSKKKDNFQQVASSTKTIIIHEIVQSDTVLFYRYGAICSSSSCPSKNLKT